MDRKIYVAIPYTRVEDRSFEMANRVAYEIIKHGDIPFSPISMSHPIVEASKHDGKYEKELLGTWEVWSKIDYSFIDWCDEIWVVCMERSLVRESVGVQAELDYGRKHNKVIRYIGVEYPDNPAVTDKYKFKWQVEEYDIKGNKGS